MVDPCANSLLLTQGWPFMVDLRVVSLWLTPGRLSIVWGPHEVSASPDKSSYSAATAPAYSLSPQGSRGLPSAEHPYQVSPETSWEQFSLGPGSEWDTPRPVPFQGRAPQTALSKGTPSSFQGSSSWPLPISCWLEPVVHSGFKAGFLPPPLQAHRSGLAAPLDNGVCLHGLRWEGPIFTSWFTRFSTLSPLPPASGVFINWGWKNCFSFILHSSQVCCL